MTDSVADLTISLLAAVRAQYEGDALRANDGPRVMRLARKLCNDAGYEPDSVSMGIPETRAIPGPKGTTGIFTPFQPAWALYWDDAINLIALVDGTKEVSDAREDSKV